MNGSKLVYLVMPFIGFKKISNRAWLRIIFIWTLAAMSISFQLYFNLLPTNPGVSWLLLFLKQIPNWYLCALLTPVVMYIYEKYPLDKGQLKTLILPHLSRAALVLMIFSNFRYFSMYFISWGGHVSELTLSGYIHGFLSQMAFDTGIYAFIMVVVFADNVNSRRKSQELYSVQMELQNKELQNQLINSKLQALKLQLNPHFLFNSLNTISSLTRMGDYNAAIQINARLGDFLRNTLYSEDENLVTLEKELFYLNLYLNIESIRFKDRMFYVENIGDNCREKLVPYLILQPLVENAIKHGIAKSLRASLIKIQAYAIQVEPNLTAENGPLAQVAAGLKEKNVYEEQRSCLVIEIYNDGDRLPEGWVYQKNSGIGLSNTYNRLKMMYNSSFSFHIENHPGQEGVVTTLKIPVNA